MFYHTLNDSMNTVSWLLADAPRNFVENHVKLYRPNQFLHYIIGLVDNLLIFCMYYLSFDSIIIFGVLKISNCFF